MIKNAVYSVLLSFVFFAYAAQANVPVQANDPIESDDESISISEVIKFEEYLAEIKRQHLGLSEEEYAIQRAKDENNMIQAMGFTDASYAEFKDSYRKQMLALSRRDFNAYKQSSENQLRFMLSMIQQEQNPNPTENLEQNQNEIIPYSLSSLALISSAVSALSGAYSVYAFRTGHNKHLVMTWGTLFILAGTGGYALKQYTASSFRALVQSLPFLAITQTVIVQSVLQGAAAFFRKPNRYLLPVIFSASTALPTFYAAVMAS